MRECVRLSHGMIEVETQRGLNGFVLMCHAHPLYGGTMDHKVMTTVAKVIKSTGLGTVRFNYRGVGQSEGAYGDVVGEVEDAIAVREWAKRHMGTCVAVMGYSFGAYVACSVRDQLPALLIAPAVHKMPYKVGDISSESMVILAAEDEVCPTKDAHHWALSCGASVAWVNGAGHYFHGSLKALTFSSSKFLFNNIKYQ